LLWNLINIKNWWFKIQFEVFFNFYGFQSWLIGVGLNARAQYLPLLWPERQSGAAVEHIDVILTNLMTSYWLDYTPIGHVSLLPGICLQHRTEGYSKLFGINLEWFRSTVIIYVKVMQGGVSSRAIW
jgi:hypothetical protein